jgi:hypothetical protein
LGLGLGFRLGLGLGQLDGLIPVALRRVLCVEQREALQAAPLPLDRRRRVGVVVRV